MTWPSSRRSLKGSRSGARVLTLALVETTRLPDALAKRARQRMARETHGDGVAAARDPRRDTGLRRKHPGDGTRPRAEDLAPPRFAREYDESLKLRKIGADEQ